MAQWQFVTNLRAKLVHHPPVVVFFICLLLLAGAFIGIGIYSENHDIRNPDISLDWNQILGSIASLRFCTDVNNTELLSGKQEDESPLLLDHGVDSISNASQITKGVVHVSLLVPLVGIGNPSYNSMSATLLGSQLGLKGVPGKELFNMSLFLSLQSQSNTDSNSAFTQNRPTTADTKPKSSMSCLKIAAPAHLLPLRLKPPECSSYGVLEKPPVRAFAAESYKPSSDNAPPCLSLKFTPDPKLTVQLTQEEKALARYHLMLVSIVLLAVCSMMCLTGTLTCSKSRRHLANDLHFQKVMLLGS